VSSLLDSALLFYSNKNHIKTKQTILVSSVSILLQLIQEAHFEQMAHKQILMCCLIEMVSMRLDVSSLIMVIVLSQIIKCILQPEKKNVIK
jgi:hypothetical protein